MNREQIEKAAGEYSGSVLGFKDNPVVMAKHKAFAAGADWRINSVWHDVNEEPIYWKLIIRKDILGDYDLGCELKHDTISWAYLDDLVPERKEETK